MHTCLFKNGGKWPILDNIQACWGTVEDNNSVILTSAIFVCQYEGWCHDSSLWATSEHLNVLYWLVQVRSANINLPWGQWCVNHGLFLLLMACCPSLIPSSSFLLRKTLTKFFMSLSLKRSFHVSGFTLEEGKCLSCIPKHWILEEKWGHLYPYRTYWECSKLRPGSEKAWFNSPKWLRGPACDNHPGQCNSCDISSGRKLNLFFLWLGLLPNIVICRWTVAVLA